jgi:hypothetical protein
MAVKKLQPAAKAVLASIHMSRERNGLPFTGSLYQSGQIEIELEWTGLDEPIGLQVVKDFQVDVNVAELRALIFEDGDFRRFQLDGIHLHENDKIGKVFFKILMHDIAVLAHTSLI